MFRPGAGSALTNPRGREVRKERFNRKVLLGGGMVTGTVKGNATQQTPSGQTSGGTGSSPQGKALTDARQNSRLELLLVDDDPRLRRVFSSELARSFEVRVADGYRQAVGMLDTGWAPAVVVSDWDLGDGPSGMELLQHCRSRLPSSVRMLVSGHASQQMFRDAVRQGVAHSFLCKPFERGELTGALRRLLKQHSGAAPKGA